MKVGGIMANKPLPYTANEFILLVDRYNAINESKRLGWRREHAGIMREFARLAGYVSVRTEPFHVHAKQLEELAKQEAEWEKMPPLAPSGGVGIRDIDEKDSEVRMQAAIDELRAAVVNAGGGAGVAATGGAKGAGKAKRRGRLSKADREAAMAALAAALQKHPTLKDDPPALAREAGVSESTARRWVEELDEKYRESAPANVPGDEN
jgi:hypothetical protein